MTLTFFLILTFALSMLTSITLLIQNQSKKYLLPTAFIWLGYININSNFYWFFKDNFLLVLKYIILYFMFIYDHPLFLFIIVPIYITFIIATLSFLSSSNSYLYKDFYKHYKKYRLKNIPMFKSIKLSIMKIFPELSNKNNILIFLLLIITIILIGFSIKFYLFKIIGVKYYDYYVLDLSIIISSFFYMQILYCIFLNINSVWDHLKKTISFYSLILLFVSFFISHYILPIFCLSSLIFIGIRMNSFNGLFKSLENSHILRAVNGALVPLAILPSNYRSYSVETILKAEATYENGNVEPDNNSTLRDETDYRILPTIIESDYVRNSTDYPTQENNCKYTHVLYPEFREAWVSQLELIKYLEANMASCARNIPVPFMRYGFIRDPFRYPMNPINQLHLGNKLSSHYFNHPTFVVTTEKARQTPRGLITFNQVTNDNTSYIVNHIKNRNDDRTFCSIITSNDSLYNMYLNIPLCQLNAYNGKYYIILIKKDYISFFEHDGLQVSNPNRKGSVAPVLQFRPGLNLANFDCVRPLIATKRGVHFTDVADIYSPQAVYYRLSDIRHTLSVNMMFKSIIASTTVSQNFPIEGNLLTNRNVNVNLRMDGNGLLYKG